jgi:two-component system, sensor histidine kinase and response regulator
MSTSIESSLAGAAPLAATQARGTASLDAAAVSGLRELDPEGRNGLVERVVKAFQESLARLAPQLLSAMQANDAKVIRHVSHTLKSSSASIGALRLSSLCAELEAAVRAGVSEGLEVRVEAICAEIENVKPALEQLARTSR